MPDIRTRIDQYSFIGSLHEIKTLVIYPVPGSNPCMLVNLMENNVAIFEGIFSLQIGLLCRYCNI